MICAVSLSLQSYLYICSATGKLTHGCMLTSAVAHIAVLLSNVTSVFFLAVHGGIPIHRVTSQCGCVQHGWCHPGTSSGVS